MFYMDRPKIWLFQDKAQIKINGIVSEKIKFYSLVSQLERKYVENIWYIVTSNSATKYLETKTRLLDLFKENEST